jgi:hypothetical protein
MGLNAAEAIEEEDWCQRSGTEYTEEDVLPKLRSALCELLVAPMNICPK